MSLKDITLGRYIYGTSLLHQLDPRTKLASILLIMAGLFARNSWYPLEIAGLYTAMAALLSGLPLFYLIRSLTPFKWLIILTVALNVLFVGGHILVEAPLPYGGITSEGLNNGLLFGARIALLVITASLLTLTTEPVVLVDGVEKLLKPFSRVGLNPHEIALAMVITIRFIPVLLDEAVKIRKSHAARGLRPVGIRANLKSVSLLFLPLFTSAVHRAEALAVAMESRLYRSDVKRTRYKEISMTRKDWVVLAVSLMFAFIMVV
ncbi:MAG: energy-coupling factor transporter transmembrane component T [Candidatus Latescibacter sp.]|nr:energy-coupling factor transporter transmembrane component T [Candidatus Latescibacter sp.]